MIKRLAVLATFLLIGSLAYAQLSGNRPSLGPGSVQPLGPSNNASAGSGGGGGCSNSLDFSQACNSQYVGIF